jgi:2-polyprenyl-3-methyl-5-hydroxy-6-metoxy-1,4-benzoquinol methylase
MAKSVSTFYDEFSVKQLETGVNIRHYSIITKLKAAGLKSNHNVLEVGCGIGTLTGLLGKFLNQGSLTATDISPESIEVAKKRCSSNKNTSFVVTDMSDFRPENQLDFVVFPDVLEHIPKDQHNNIFRNVSALLKSNGKIAVHIPDPVQLDFIRNYNPDQLQIIDQSLYFEDFKNAIEGTDLMLDTYLRYKLYSDSPDYNWIVFSRKHKLNKSGKQSKILLKIKQLYWKFLG